MKKLISILAAITILCGAVKAEYQPFLVDGKAWTVIWYNVNSDGPSGTCLEKSASYRVLPEKREVNGLICNKVIEYRNRDWLLSEAGRKVYLVDEESEKTYLLYDFNVHKGDKFTFKYADNSAESFDLLVVSEEDVDFEDRHTTIKLRRITFEDGRVWVEGLGAPNVDSFATIFPSPSYERETEVCLTYFYDDVAEWIIWNWNYFIKGTDVEVGLNEQYARPYVDPAKRYDLLGRELSGEPATGSYYIEAGKLKRKI